MKLNDLFRNSHGWLRTLIVIIALGSATEAWGQIQHVGVPDPMNFYEHQPSTTTCWAACDAMILKSQSIDVTAADIVTKSFGHFDPFESQGAGAELSMPADQIDGTWTNSSEGTVNFTTHVRYGLLGSMTPPDVQALISSLSQNNPVVFATCQHGRVCVGADYFEPPFGPPAIVSLTFLDPDAAPGMELQTVSLNALFQMCLFEHGYLGMITFDTSN